MPHYDVAVIGAGPAGFAAAMRAWDYGKDVALIERGSVGGAGIHNGALTSKTLWELSLDYRRALRRDRGFLAHGVTLDYRQVVSCVETAAAEKTGQLRRQLEVLSKRGTEGGRVTLLRGNACFVNPHELEVRGTEPGDVSNITADNIVLATGSRPRVIDSIPVDGRFILTSDHLTRLEDFPSSIVIIGAGVIGCEFATILANYGKTKVFLIDRAARILPFEDEDIARLVAHNLEEKGVTIHQGANLESICVENDRVHYTIRHKTGGIETIEVSKALVSIGRVPNTSGLCLDNANVEVTERGHIRNEDTRTSVPHIYAVGDVTLDLALVAIGELEGRRAVEHMYGAVTTPLSYKNVSAIMFLDPEVAGVGMNELQAQKERVPYKVAVYEYKLVNRAIAMRATQGFVKLLVSDDEKMTVLGMRALGAHASTSIETCALLIRQGASVHVLAEMLHPHPSVTEGLQDCVRMLLGSSIMKPRAFPGELRLSSVGYGEG